jgi:Uma2 family endonuclease
MSLAQEKIYYTYADFLEWDESVRYEVMDGEALMLAAPDRVHQNISMALSNQLYDFLKGKTCKVYAAPFAVRLNPAADLSDDTVFEPDIVVVCDPSKLDKRGCNGPPDLVIEILSPSTARYDRIVKLRRYQQAGVREYWIVDPETNSVQVFLFEPKLPGKAGGYTGATYDETDTAPVTVLPGCEIDLKAVFTETV